jgi:type III secretion system low calcium response chaperone LcrH/SycD
MEGKMAEKEYQTIEEALKAVAPHLSEKERKKQLEAIEQVILHGVPFKDSLGISPEILEFIYSQGHRLYSIRKYKEAGRFFQLLYILNPNDARFSFALAACHHMQKNFDDSVAWYLVAALIDRVSPLPFYHISDCYLVQNDYAGALHFLRKTLNRIGDNAKYSQLKERVARSIESVEKEVEQEQTVSGEQKL